MLAFVGPYGAVRLFQYRAFLDAGRLVRLIAAAAAVAAAAAPIVLPYVGAAAWGAARRQGILVPFSMLLPGHQFAIGGTTLGLASLLLFLRDRRRAPAVPVLAAGVTCMLLAGRGRLWPTGPFVRGVYPWFADRVWLLGIVRVPAAIRTGAYLAVPLLAGLGLGRLFDRLSGRPWKRLLIGIALSGPLLTEHFGPRAVALVERQPARAVLDAYAVFDRTGLAGPIVEMPFDADGKGIVGRMPLYTLLAAYHGRQTAACFTSHTPPSYHEVNRMVAQAAAGVAAGIVELAAAGFRNVVVHERPWGRIATRLADTPGVRRLISLPSVSAFRITRPVFPHPDASLLRLERATRGVSAFKPIRIPWPSSSSGPCRRGCGRFPSRSCRS